MKFISPLALLIFMLSFVSSAQAAWLMTEDNMNTDDTGEETRRVTSRTITADFNAKKPSSDVEGASIERVNKNDLAAKINSKIITDGHDDLEIEGIYFDGINNKNLESLQEILKNLRNVTRDVSIKAYDAKKDETAQAALDDLVNKTLKSIR